MNRIGTLSENSLHASLKNYIRMPGDLIETPVDNYIIDIVRGDTLFEVQIKNFYSMRPKLDRLLDQYQIHIVHPIPHLKWIVRFHNTNKSSTRRKSPKKGTIYHVFDQLVYIGDYLSHPHLTIDVLLVEQEDLLRNDGKGSWRRKGWSLQDQRLIQVRDHIALSGSDCYQHLLPNTLPTPFRTSDLATTAGIPVRLAQKIAYTLTKSGYISRIGKQGKAYLYKIRESQ